MIKFGISTEGTPERSFLEKIKTSLANVSDIGQLLGIIVRIAKEFGLSMEQLKNLFQ